MVKKSKQSLSDSKEAYGIIGFIFAIVSLLSMASNGIIYAILGIVFSKLQQKRNPNKISRIGFILGIIGLILNILLIIFLIFYYPAIIQDLQVQFPYS